MHQVVIISVCSLFFFLSLRFWSKGFLINCGIILLFLLYNFPNELSQKTLLFWIMSLFCPLMLINTSLYVFVSNESLKKTDPTYQVKFRVEQGNFKINNIRRGASIIGSAGSGKTESVVYGFLLHFSRHSFCGIIHDYKNLELTEITYPLFKNTSQFFIISFDPIFHRVNPIAPQYLENVESVNEISRVLLENLLEQKDSFSSGANKFFYDAAEGLLGGLIWKLKVSYPHFCTIPHLIAIYQNLPNESLVSFLSSNSIAKSMANAFISGVDSERQTAGVKSTLANALKKICTKNIFYTLSADEVPLNVNSAPQPVVISVVNNPKYESAYSPVIAAIMHTVTKQMSVRNSRPSFVLMEEAPTIRLLNMHRIPATLRSYNVSTVYVMQDKIQNDLLYGEKASKAILSNLSYQFFGKVNDPDTAKYYERFFEVVKKETVSVNRGHNLNFDTRITTGEKEVAKVRADLFFRLKEGEFMTYADGVDKKVQFRLQKIQKDLPPTPKVTNEDLENNFAKIYREASSIFST